MKVILKRDIKSGLKEIGLQEGDIVMVHTSLKSMGYVCGGAQTVIEALIETVGEDFEKSNTVNTVQIGNATVKLMNQIQLVDYAVKWMEENR